jgi:ABC transporter substrate binding protein (PQQ-dependent alcohol dehydrogenase system)
MISRVIVFVVGLLMAATAAWADAPVTVIVAYIDRADDAKYATVLNYGRLNAGSVPSPYSGAALAFADGRLIGEAVGVQFVLDHVTLQDGEDAAARIRSELQAKHIVAAVLDLPPAEMENVALGLADAPLVLLNAREMSQKLRQSTCRTHLFHAIPSVDMLEDALAQVLVKRNWKSVLVVEGDDPEDKDVSALFQAAAAKFGLTVTGVRSFVPGTDPRDRDRNNPRLITGEADYDVVFVADHTGDFARSLAYNTLLPRPIVGAAGLMPSAWHPYWERQGAPQLNRRFEKVSKRAMTDLDWSAWAAGRAIVEGVVRGKARDGASLIAALLDPALTLELYKGNAGSFRAWNRQLRQPILLGTDVAVVAFAPVPEMLHQRNTLDTLGFDEPEFHCP